MEPQISTARIAMKWGLIAGVASIVFSTVVFLTKQFGNQAIGYLGYLILIGAMIFGMRDYKSQNNTFMSYAQGLGIGTMLCAVSSVISGGFSYLYMTVIDPTIPQQMFDKVQQEWEKGGMTAEQIEQAASMTKLWMSPGALFVVGVFFSILMGFIISLIISAVMKKNKPEMEF